MTFVENHLKHPKERGFLQYLKTSFLTKGQGDNGSQQMRKIKRMKGVPGDFFAGQQFRDLYNLVLLYICVCVC